ncbi:MAG: hypothetical protein M3N68_04740 [Actinomycetota bacterium]|nr:hypothetical protein [Actinomycetota bacterium]
MPPVPPRHLCRLWLASFVVVLVAGQLAVGMRASGTASVTGDEPFYLLTTQSLSSDGDLDLDDEYRDHEEGAFWDGTVPLWKQMEPTADGRLLAPHDPGLPVLALPAYQLGGLRGVQRFLVVVWAAAMACGALLARRAGGPWWAALLGAAVVGAGAPGVVYASQVYPEGPAALCLAVALLVASGRRARPVVLAGALAALAWLGVKYVPVGALVAAAWAWRFRSDRRALAVAAGMAGATGAHFVWWHLRTFGGLTPYASNVVWAGEGTARILDHHLALTGRAYRLYGLFLDARFGLFRWLPAALLAGWGLRRRAGLPAGVVGVCVLMGTFVSITMMGWWFPGRMLVAGFPALVVLVALGAARLPRVALGLSAWSLAIATALVWSARTGGVRLAVDPWTMGFPLPPAALFPDFRSFTWRQVLQSCAWGAALAISLWATSFDSSRTGGARAGPVAAAEP